MSRVRSHGDHVLGSKAVVKAKRDGKSWDRCGHGGPRFFVVLLFGEVIIKLGHKRGNAPWEEPFNGEDGVQVGVPGKDSPLCLFWSSGPLLDEELGRGDTQVTFVFVLPVQMRAWTISLGTCKNRHVTPLQ